jgi:heptosyltransferase-2
MRVDPTRVNRLVIRAPNWLGDAVMALPAMGAMRAAFRGHLAVAVIPSIAPLFEEDTNVEQDSILVLKDARQERKALAAGQYDAALLLPNSFRSAWSARKARIPARWGYATQFRWWQLTDAVPPPRGRVHQSVYYVELVRRLGIDAPEEPPRVSVRSTTSARATALLAERGVGQAARLVGFAPGAAYGHAKRWPPRRVSDLIVRLSRESGAVCVLFGADGDRDAGREIESSLPPDVRAVNLIARTDLRLLAGVIARCSAFVSNDSGAMHLAAALGVPVTSIFGPTDDRVTSPLGSHGSQGTPVSHDVLTHPVFCRPCMLRDCPIDHRCMKGVSVETVFAAVTRRFEGVEVPK